MTLANERRFDCVNDEVVFVAFDPDCTVDDWSLSDVVVLAATSSGVMIWTGGADGGARNGETAASSFEARWC